MVTKRNIHTFQFQASKHAEEKYSTKFFVYPRWKMSPSIADIAIPFGVGGLVSFLAYSSQYLLRDLQPGPVTVRETWTFNILVTCIWICYYRSCLVDPGHIPKDWKASPTDDSGSGKADTTREDDVVQHHRWCRKCESLKPPRTHHCKGCGRYVFFLLTSN